MTGRKNYKKILNVMFPVAFFIISLATCNTTPDLLNEGKICYIKLEENERSPVSQLLVGFNTVYPHESNLVWSEGKIEEYLKEAGASVIRYPGGTVTSFYHWNALTGEGWKDSWDPDNPVIAKDGSEFMELDEFISLAQKTGIVPLLGINMSSGRRWHREDDGVKEALELMKYCQDMNFNVTYWYLDNEPYQQDSNGGAKSVEEYAAMVNQYAGEMKKFNPDIKIIVNWKSGFEERREDYKKLLEIAGSNIDIIDVHWYWSWDDPTYEKWLSKTPMGLWTGKSYLSEIAYFSKMVIDFGYPDIMLASLEWNIGPIKDHKINPHQCALIQSEMMMQFMSGGLDISAFWPLQWPGDAATARSFVRREDRSAQPVYTILKFLGKIQGENLIKSDYDGEQENILSLVSLNKDDTILRVCLLNKSNDDIIINIESDLFNNMKLSSAEVFVLTDQGGDVKNVKLAKHTPEEITFNSSNHSTTMLIFTKE